MTEKKKTNSLLLNDLILVQRRLLQTCSHCYLAALLQLLLHLLSRLVHVDDEVWRQELTDADVLDLVVVLHTCTGTRSTGVTDMLVLKGTFSPSVLTLLPDVAMFEHGLQEDHVAEGGPLQDDSLTLKTEDQLYRRSRHNQVHSCSHSSVSGTCGEQVLDGVRVLQQPHQVHPQLKPVAVPVSSFGVRVELLQTAHPVKVDGEGLLLP